MARKGILVSDPQVLRTSKAQWLWEYQAVAKKEHDDREFYTLSLRKILISILGLDLVPPLDANGEVKPKEEYTEEDKNFFIPMVLLAGNHHLMMPYLKKLKALIGQDEISSTVDIKEYEEQAKMLLDGGDMDPIIDPLVGKNPTKIIIDSIHKNLNVQVIDNKVVQVPTKKVRNVVTIED